MNQTFPTIILNIGDDVIHQSPFKVGTARANRGRPRYGRVFNKHMAVPKPHFTSEQILHGYLHGTKPSAECHYSINFEDGTLYECSQYIADRFLRVGTRKIKQCHVGTN